MTTTTAPAAPSSTYAGEISPDQAWRRLSQEEKAKLIDVRTQAEWSFVGVPD
ncbi:MAG: rhodanese-like domain-containing protein, partial [Magnetospirillum sp.]